MWQQIQEVNIACVTYCLSDVLISARFSHNPRWIKVSPPFQLFDGVKTEQLHMQTMSKAQVKCWHLGLAKPPSLKAIWTALWRITMRCCQILAIIQASPVGFDRDVIVFPGVSRLKGQLNDVWHMRQGEIAFPQITLCSVYKNLKYLIVSPVRIPKFCIKFSWLNCARSQSLWIRGWFSVLEIYSSASGRCVLS